MKFLIAGGCKNGKSSYAQRLAQAQQRGARYTDTLCADMRYTDTLYYVATMRPGDREDEERIKRHRRERDGWGFITIEQPRDISGILEMCHTGGSFLLDSLTALLANEMFNLDGEVNLGATGKITNELIQIFNHIDNIVIVSDAIYSDALPYDQLTKQYRQSLAALDRQVAESCDVVLEIAYTKLIVHKGKERLEAFYETIS